MNSLLNYWDHQISQNKCRCRQWQPADTGDLVSQTCHKQRGCWQRSTRRQSRHISVSSALQQRVLITTVSATLVCCHQAPQTHPVPTVQHNAPILQITNTNATLSFHLIGLFSMPSPKVRKLETTLVGSFFYKPDALPDTL